VKKGFLVFLTTIVLIAMLTPLYTAVATEMELGYLELTLEIDPSAQGFTGDVGIQFDGTRIDQRYEYFFRHSRNFELRNNRVRMAVDTYSVEIFLHGSNSERFAVITDDGQPVTTAIVNPEGTTLALRLIEAIGDVEPIQQLVAETTVAQLSEGVLFSSTGNDISSLIPVMEAFHENTLHAVDGTEIIGLENWTTRFDTARSFFLREPDHTPEMWDALTVYERTNYRALVEVPYSVIFEYGHVTIDVNDKTPFLDAVIRNIRILSSGIEDNDRYFNEALKVIDWIWYHYAEHFEFINVVKVYASYVESLDGYEASAVTEAVQTPYVTAEMTIGQATPEQTNNNAQYPIENMRPYEESSNGIFSSLVGALRGSLTAIILLAVVAIGYFVARWHYKQKNSFQSEGKKA